MIDHLLPTFDAQLQELCYPVDVEPLGSRTFQCGGVVVQLGDIAVLDEFPDSEGTLLLQWMKFPELQDAKWQVLTLKRRRSEDVSKFLKRNGSNIHRKVKQVMRGGMKRKQAPAADLTLKMSIHGHPKHEDIVEVVDTTRRASNPRGDDVEESSTVSLTHGEYWECAGSNITLSINGAETSVFFMPPVVKFAVPFQSGQHSLLVDVPLRPYVECLNCNAIHWEWRRHRPEDWNPTSQEGRNSKNPPPRDRYEDEAFVVVQEGVGDEYAVFTPSAAEAGFYLSVVVTPLDRKGNPGWNTRAIRYTQPVSRASPPPTCIGLRADWVGALEASDTGGCPPSAIVLRVASYNILSDMYHAYDPQQLLEKRLPLVLLELLSLGAEIVCLQEVDEKVFHLYLKPILHDKYHCSFAIKNHDAAEGCALFCQKSAVKVLSEQRLIMADLVEKDKALVDILETSPSAKDIILNKVNTIAQVAELQLNNGSAMLIANTHLFYHPQADHIRILQIHALVSHLCDRWHAYPFVLCGDLNSDPQAGAVRLLVDGHVDNAHDSWSYLHKYEWEENKGAPSLPPRVPSLAGNLDVGQHAEDNGSGTLHDAGDVQSSKADVTEECNMDSIQILGNEATRDGGSSSVVVGQALSDDELRKEGSRKNCLEEKTQQQLHIPCRPLIAVTGFPAFTNYSGSFIETLDYVFCGNTSQNSEDDNTSTEIIPISGAPMPDQSHVHPNEAMPCPGFPSDHVSVAAHVAIVTSCAHKSTR